MDNPHNIPINIINSHNVLSRQLIMISLLIELSRGWQEYLRIRAKHGVRPTSTASAVYRSKNSPVIPMVAQ